MDTSNESSQAPSRPRETEASISLCRYMAVKVRNYPWKTTYILSHDNLEQGWEQYDHQKKEMVPLTRVISIAAKIATFERDLFQGDHTREIMATRGCLQYDLYGDAPPASSLASLAAATTKQMTNNKHGYAPHRANSLLTSYRLLDILAELLGCHERVQLRDPADNPKVLGKPTYLLKKYEKQLRDIPTLLKDFRSAWECNKRREPSTCTDDVLLGHIKAVLESGKRSHAQMVEANLLASALPIIIMSRSELLPTENESTGPVAPELLEGLDEFIKGNYIDKKVLVEEEKRKACQLFTRKNIVHMRKPHGVSVHVSPLLNLANGNLQTSNYSEDDIIQTSRMIGTHKIPLLLSIERHIWNALWAISMGESSITAINKLVQDLPWDELEKVGDDHEINRRFTTGYRDRDEPTEADEPDKVHGHNTQALASPTPNSQPPASPVLETQATPASLPGQASKKQKRDSMGKTKIKLAPIVQLSHTESNADALDTAQAYPVCRLDSDLVFHDALGGFSQTRDALLSIQETIVASYHEGKPRYISTPENSVIQVITSDDLQSKTAREVQNIFRQHHILETSRHNENVAFDLATLDTAGPLRKSILVRDQALPDGDEDSGVLRSYTLENLYSIRHSGRAVRTLQMSLLCAATNDIGAFATDRRAYHNRNYCPEKDHTGQERPFPAQQLEWSLVALKGATQDLRMNPDGAGMWVECTAGKVWYILLRPIESLDFCKFGNTNEFQNDASLDDLLRKYDVEGVLLLPGMRLFVRPCTPCAFVTIENAVLHGGHFYAFSTMPETFFGMVHNLAGGSCITRFENSRFRHLIRLIVQYVHGTLVLGDDYQLPFFRHTMDSGEITLENILGLFAVIYIGILCNALDQDSYKLRENHSDEPHLREQMAHARMAEYDYNAMPYEDRAGCTFARGCAYELRDWFCHHYQIEGYRDTTMVVTQKIIAHQACALLKVTLDSNNKQLLCTTEAVKRQILNTFRPDSPEWISLASRIAKAEQGQASPSMYISLEGCTISKIHNPATYHPCSANEIKGTWYFTFG